MPMPPNVNLYDPRKNRQLQSGQQPQQQQQPVQQPATPVGSSLSPMPGQQQTTQAGQPPQTVQVEKKKPATPVTYQQQAGAVSDPRFSQALAQKLQQDVAAKQAALQQQQAQFQEQLGQASAGVSGAQTRITDILGKVQSGTASDADLAEFQKLQQAQYQGPAGLEGTASIAALSQLAGSPGLLAQQYAGFAPGGVSAGDFQRAMAGLQKTPELAAAQEAATGLAQQATSAEEVAAQQAALLKGQTEAAKQQAETGIQAEREKYMAGLGEEAKSQIEAKKGALDKLKAGLFMGQKVSSGDLQKLGLSKEDIVDLKGLDISQVEGLGDVKSVEDLDKAVKKLQKQQIESGSAESVLTPEQDRLISAYTSLSEMSRETDEAAGIAYAKKEDLNKINALRRLSGKPPLTEEEVGKLGTGAASGGISKDRLSSLKGLLKSGEEAYMEEANLTVPKKQERLSGDKWYKGGLVKASDDLSKLDANTNTNNIHTIARQMYDQMQKTGAKENNVYNWLKNNLGKIATGTKGAKNKKWDPKQMAQQFKDLINQNKESYTKAITGRSSISKDLTIE